MNRAALWSLLAVVAAAAAVLSFSSLRNLAIACGYSATLAPLFPVTVDAGCAAGTLAWLGQPGPARLFGRSLALGLLLASIAGNTLAHILTSSGQRPSWVVVVVVSGLAPGVLAGVAHLAVLTSRTSTGGAEIDVEPLSEPDRYVENPETRVEQVEADPVAELIESGVGRRKLARELSISEHAARQLLRTNGASR